MTRLENNTATPLSIPARTRDGRSTQPQPQLDVTDDLVATPIAGGGVHLARRDDFQAEEGGSPNLEPVLDMLANARCSPRS